VDDLEVDVRAKPGAAVVLDARLRHRFSENDGSELEPLLYFSYAARWFADPDNAGARHLRSWADLENRTDRALLSRFGDRAYVRALERALGEEKLRELRLADADELVLREADAARFYYV